MILGKVRLTILLLAVSTAIVSCDEDTEGADNKGGQASENGGDGTDGTGSENETGEPEDIVTATLLVPSSFDGVPELIGISFFATDPPTGMPDGFGDRYENPGIVAGEEFSITSTQAALDGEYYMTVVVYCEGGGGGQVPIAGVDWNAKVGEPLSLGPGTGVADAGSLELVIAE